MEWIAAHAWPITIVVALWAVVLCVGVRWWAKVCHAEYRREVLDRFGSADRCFNRDELTDRAGYYDPSLSDALNELVTTGEVERVPVFPGQTMYRRKRPPAESEAA